MRSFETEQKPSWTDRFIFLVLGVLFAFTGFTLFHEPSSRITGKEEYIDDGLLYVSRIQGEISGFGQSTPHRHSSLAPRFTNPVGELAITKDMVKSVCIFDIQTPSPRLEEEISLYVQFTDRAKEQLRGHFRANSGQQINLMADQYTLGHLWANEEGLNHFEGNTDNFGAPQSPKDPDLTLYINRPIFWPALTMVATLTGNKMPEICPETNLLTPKELTAHYGYKRMAHFMKTYQE
ncbi:hypothetical protein [Kordiimonas sp. SCSIO 12610]|uniref:hypothetical protein n=1 Tax=Kordiimonas sp. SCSIO 12610 TaxID=2829597 RepID=UPI00210AC594|nr:hypothetical protein [Kordiimonas sp. SCSIO 12610]UTW56176.1 hypothetical protein KFF44_04570 [Kordiimonas sp. SCSIO 12610]